MEYMRIWRLVMRMTLVSPRYAHLFHEILWEIAKCLNVNKMVEEKNGLFELARREINDNLPAWSMQLQSIAEGVHMVNPEKACHELLSEIVQKTFNSKGSAVLKRYYSIFLARGGKESSQCNLLESRKQEGRGSTTKKKRKKEQEGTPTLMIVK